ncbi:uncharacterized protein EI90DRAFT_3151519 [Cantharellus anzutake]|uniref:uncharacterized protein n=1 Tax=Cantharellus anzutake TaxID=1750568 RepID=UPI001906979E|nr:uncharacterized protein EI90DRAFT_3151519 [Cantharellus anzutake]KAF8338889.1 hypothetical protein EI90DRAFT_3151519 [Cantharellus anzutake]
MVHTPVEDLNLPPCLLCASLAMGFSYMTLTMRRPTSYRFWLESCDTTLPPSILHQRSSRYLPLGSSKYHLAPFSTDLILRATSTFSPLPPHLYRTISSHLYIAFTEGTYLKDSEWSEEEKKEKEENPPNPLADPGTMDGMVEGLKKQMVMGAADARYGMDQFLLSGFCFESENGQYIDPFRFFLSELLAEGQLFPAHLCTALRTAADSTPDMAAQASPFGSVLSGANAPPVIGPGAPDYKKLFAQEKEEQYKWVCDGVVLEQWGKIRAIK